jgi:hypothetical protein
MIKKESSDSVSNSIEEMEDIGEMEDIKDESSLPDTIREIRTTLFRENPLKMGKISGENAKGMHSIVVLNNFLEESYGFRLSALDDLSIDVMQRRISIDATGQIIFVEALGKINASFNNAQQERLTDIFRRK